MAKADYSQFLANNSYQRNTRKTAADHATQHMQTMFKVNTLLRVALPAVFAITTGAQLSAGIASRVDTSFGALDAIRANLGAGAAADAGQIIVTQDDTARLFAHLKKQ